MKKESFKFEEYYDIDINYLELLDFIISEQLSIESKQDEISKKLKESEFLSDGQCVELQVEKIKLKSKFETFDKTMVKLIKIIKKNGVVSKEKQNS